MTSARTNKEGLTFDEWLYAAGVSGADGLKPPILTLSSAHSAWWDGEDPTEWRAEDQKGVRLE